MASCQRRQEAGRLLTHRLSDFFNGSFQPSNDMMLKFYSYYKQATVGKCNIPRPGFWDAVGKAKWDAWNSLGDMTKEAAMAAYVDEMKLILEGMPMTGEVEELLQVLGPFYELVDEKKKITQISDLSTARLTKFARQLEGFGTALNTMCSKSMAKSIVRNMEMNGTLETQPAKIMPKDEEETSGDEEEEEEERDVETQEVRKASQPKKKGSGRTHKAANGGVAHLSNGSHSLAPQDGQPLLNGHHEDASTDEAAPTQLASDSDSEVYCDSVDQFGQDEARKNANDNDHISSYSASSLEQNRSLDDLEEEDCEGVQGPPQVIKCGGEDGDTGRSITQRSRLNVDMPNSSLGGKRGSRSSSRGFGALKPVHSGGDDGNGGRRGGASTPGIDLNEQIVAALAQLQDDMRSVLERLHTLEALTATQARSAAMSPVHQSTPVNRNSQKPSWWPFDISPTSLAFAVVWPFVVQWLISLYLQRRRRRLN
ncbi:acyl-CoA-binding domain-containing protein 5A isoform X2 [Dunckerocampus dactyliophorus]|uniref:acyl-CoA-binding domain-containing protein 5A isoform X2 n=1 Tax=Dunckerocampus dactyliophorus TaxID=161453 RepID=UPI0024073D92|nr:acyl-CoA-binding domain-containing protein 5A isoform X2 [Dunckerocampus dactyliophorus]